MSKAAADYAFMFEVLMDKSAEHQTFDVISTIILKKFPKHDYLSVGTLLHLLVRNGDLSGLIQRLHVHFITYELFKNECGAAESPFLAVFLDAAQPRDTVILSKAIIIERNFVGQLLTHGSKELGKITAGHLVMQPEILLHPFDLSALRAQNFERAAELPRTVRASMPNLLASVTTVQSLPAPPTDVAIRQMMESLTGADGPLKNVLAPNFMSIAPPLLPVEDELVWFDLTNPAWHRPMYDASISNISAEAKRLVALVFTEPLNIQDRHVLLAELEKDAQMVHHIGLTPIKLPRLVENNPLVAIEILLKLMHSSHITEYLNVLVNMDMSLYSMEVVNRLTTSVDLPTEFVYLYISNCISTCETITDIYAQTRLVRLLCVLLQSLIRNKIINVKDLFIEVEAFCVEFSRIKEAAGLYRLLKQLEMGETTTTTSTTTTVSTAAASSASSTTTASSASTTVSTATKTSSSAVGKTRE